MVAVISDDNGLMHIFCHLWIMTGDENGGYGNSTGKKVNYYDWNPPG
jgi:hypothetical protein